MKEQGEPGNRLPLLCVWLGLVGRVCFTFHFTLTGGGVSSRTRFAKVEY